MTHTFSQVDVFTAVPYLGNPVAVVHDADGLSDADMAAFARWTNLSETTFLLQPSGEGAAAGADYRLRIFTPTGELPFAGHPTVGSCHAWLAAGGVPARDGVVGQECGVGVVAIRRSVAAGGGERLAFAAPGLRRDEPVADDVLARLVTALGVPADAVVDHRVLDNGPEWTVVLLDSAERVLALAPDWSGVRDDVRAVGVVAPAPEGAGVAFEVRGFALDMGIPEDPVTGSLNASVGQWLQSVDRAPASYVAAQGARLGRAGRVHVTRDAEGTVWVGGDAVTCIRGEVLIPAH
ncbi:PhzF family phenazine biosynthesis protein [Luteimicrobium subarcticum]|uniref:PhzF family phenazine biosynthesis protein n=1 Tax=Luteimicrobium subarcticum TaxID=620910 RepID=A0A2M8WJA0_9MICO|nr:PhzF family phenazine biosynthesis protein [Luteimicrobium subarcticum]PJI91010.1 PhzF family phenazine biosynthesis protein [Luteimicrobium subarcticum]